MKRASIGLDGKFGDSSWTWDGYYQFGRTNREQLVHDNLHNNATALALNVVDGSGDGAARVRGEARSVDSAVRAVSIRA